MIDLSIRAANERFRVDAGERDVPAGTSARSTVGICNTARASR